ncbi:unnamed protein product [Linum tenue]|uniref:Uncharacterized protein n=1 Tax=Linum tenue TaxID=586396 RepID=A0AAV0RPN4_9ROSI|nr:unnamed protein product [Linum tenue]
MLTWIASGISNSLDALFLSRFEAHRAEYWQTLYSSVVSKHIYRSSVMFPLVLFTTNSDYHFISEYWGSISFVLLRKRRPCSLHCYSKFCR